jgi:hypothetical protein
LARMLTKSSWAALRGDVLPKTGGRCEMCGTGGDMECHELWEYHEPTGDWPGVQRLQGIIALCKPCHETHHLGYADARGRLGATLERLAASNRWSMDETRDYAGFLRERQERRSKFQWVLDVAAIARPGRVLRVKRH